jgi:hypothetical protein
MASLTHDQIDDFVLATLDRYKRDQWIDISMILQEYHFASRWFKEKNRPEQGGVRLNWKLRVDNQGTAKHSGLYAVDATNRKNVLTEGKQEWSKQTVNYIYDIDEDAFQSGPETIIREMQLNEQGLYNDIFALMETAMWTKPANDSVNPRPPSGIPTWIVKNATLGFTGADPAGFSSGVGGIATATYPRWKNYTGPYVQVTRDDLIEKIVNAMDLTNFKPPAPYPEIGGGDAQWGLYTVHSVLATCRQLLQSNNDNLGADVGRWSGEVLVRGVPLTWVPALTESGSDAYDSSAPVYGLNWKKFEYVYKTGRSMLKHPPKQAAMQHTVRERYMDNWGNFACYDRRQGGFVFYVA